jgi:DNA polymerase
MSSEWAVSALTWWQEAGVDTIVGETPRNWLQTAPPPQAAKSAPAGAAVPETPSTLAEFQAWLLASPDLPFAAPGAPRVGPAGDPEAGAMILIDMPSAGDLAAGTLLSGEAGALFDRMIGAIGLSRDTIYLAPLSPARSPSGAIDAKSAAALADIALRHIALAAPKAVLLFGDQCAKALLGSVVAGARGRWHALESPAGPIKTLVTIRPEKLLQQPGMKKLAWEDLQMFREGCKE